MHDAVEAAIKLAIKAHFGGLILFFIGENGVFLVLNPVTDLAPVGGNESADEEFFDGIAREEGFGNEFREMPEIAHVVVFTDQQCFEVVGEVAGVLEEVGGGVGFAGFGDGSFGLGAVGARCGDLFFSGDAKFVDAVLWHGLAFLKKSRTTDWLPALEIAGSL